MTQAVTYEKRLFRFELRDQTPRRRTHFVVERISFSSRVAEPRNDARHFRPSFPAAQLHYARAAFQCRAPSPYVRRARLGHDAKAAQQGAFFLMRVQRFFRWLSALQYAISRKASALATLAQNVLAKYRVLDAVKTWNIVLRRCLSHCAAYRTAKTLLAKALTGVARLSISRQTW